MKTIKQQITHKTKTLQATWTVDMVQDMQAEHGLDLEDEIARVLKEEIDRELINEAFRKDCMIKGWTEAPFKTNKFTADELGLMIDWLKVHATGDYKTFGDEVWFENKQDLTAFILKWSK